jgi:glycosyltransferase involved in cell wall biosynthesis
LAPVKLYDWKEKARIRPKKGDILIGHLFPDDDSRVWNRACLTEGFRAKIALVPVAWGMPEYCWSINRYVSFCDRLLGITGPYWYEHWMEGPLLDWYPKLRPIDMAVDLARFPRVKHRFNAKGKRQFFYIGHSTAFKGVHLVSTLFARGRDKHRCLWYGSDREMPYLERRPFTRFEGKALEEVADRCDFFITMGISDANPTTLLETMAWGFPVACTPQSGYHAHPEMLALSTTDMDLNLALLDRLQNEDEESLLERAGKARQLVAEHYNWQIFESKVLEEVRRFL